MQKKKNKAKGKVATSKAVTAGKPTAEPITTTVTVDFSHIVKGLETFNQDFKAAIAELKGAQAEFNAKADSITAKMASQLK